MNKYSISILFCLLLVLKSCIPAQELTGSLHTILINKTDKKIIFIVETGIGRKNIISNGQDSVGVIFTETVRSSCDIGVGPSKGPHISIMKEILYNLSDTTSFENTGQLPDLASNEEKTYKKKMSGGGLEGSTDANPIRFRKLLVDDELLGIMKKDYTMLEKFPEYYQQGILKSEAGVFTLPSPLLEAIYTCNLAEFRENLKEDYPNLATQITEIIENYE